MACFFERVNPAKKNRLVKFAKQCNFAFNVEVLESDKWFTVTIHCSRADYKLLFKG